MKCYKDLNLRYIREQCDLDFAHYTYKRGQCSCCYGPEDLPSIYWKNRTIRKDDNYTYVLFKNADNGSGHVTKNSEIKDYTCIAHRFIDVEQKEKFCKMLTEQLDDDYTVLIPKDDMYCIIIRTVHALNYERRCHSSCHSSCHSNKYKQLKKDYYVL